MEVLITPENDPRDYIGYDLHGYAFNLKYPPNRTLYGDSFEGYASKAEGILLYDYVVMGYDVEFSFSGKKYVLLNTGEGILSDETYSNRIAIFNNPMELVEHLEIDGQPLITLIHEIEDIEVV